MQKVKVGANRRYLTDETDRPFFWLADTAWELLHRLTFSEANHYLEDRAAKGFNVIQTVVLAELDGLNEPNRQGHVPLIDNDPTKPNELYFAHVDAVIDRAEQLGLVVALLPTWGDKFNLKWGVGPEVFTPDNARTFAEFLGKRYKEKPIVWVLCGDRDFADEEDERIVRAMGEVLRATTDQLITFHPQGGRSSSEFVHGEPWIDFNLMQSGHSTTHFANYNMIARDYALLPTKPVIDGEPCYEDHPIRMNPENGWFDDFDSRRAGYWAVLNGACGHTYGHHSVWQLLTPSRSPISAARTPWREALDYPGAFQAGLMRRLFESRPWHLLKPSVPAASAFVKRADSSGKETFAAFAEDGSFAFVYAPFGTPFELKLDVFTDEVLVGWWFNARDGHSISLGEFAKELTRTFVPPNGERRGNDWVLVLDAKTKAYGRPGKTFR